LQTHKLISHLQVFMLISHRPKKNFSFIVILLFGIGFLTYQCEKEHLILPPEIIEEEPPFTVDSAARFQLPRYYNFLVSLKDEGYVFMDFKTYLKSDTSKLPQKLIVIRHDVHTRDVQWAYIAYEIEKLVIGNRKSTFYVMLNDPLELVHGNQANQDNYMKLIHHLDSGRMDVQPHISPIDMYIETRKPIWMKLSADSLQKLFAANYKWEIVKNGRNLVTLEEDVFQIQDINTAIKALLTAYNSEWTNQTGLRVQGYAAHGSATAMNKVLNNAWILDQLDLLEAGIYEYDTYNTKIFNFLTYLSDNSLPQWMINPSQIKPGRYQFLMHPYQWQVKMAEFKETVLVKTTKIYSYGRNGMKFKPYPLISKGQMAEPEDSL
jgi:hypothetical protein